MLIFDKCQFRKLIFNIYIYLYVSDQSVYIGSEVPTKPLKVSTLQYNAMKTVSLYTVINLKVSLNATKITFCKRIYI